MCDSFDIFIKELESRLIKRGKININNRNENQKNGKTERINNFNHRQWLLTSYSTDEIEKCRRENKIFIEPSIIEGESNIFLKSFKDIHLNIDAHNKLRNLNILKPTPIQMQMIPIVLSGYNVFGQSTTGTGKTLCFSLPLIIMKLNKDPNFKGAVILVPTRELCGQIKYFLEQFVSITSIFGGVRNKTKHFESTDDVILATPGKLLQYLEKQNFIENFSHLILDEADKMTSSEFLNNLKAIIAKMKSPKFCVLAATCFNDTWLRRLLKIDVNVFVGEKNTANEYVIQKVKLVFDKFSFLMEIVKKNVVIFVNSKDKADELTLKIRGFLRQKEQEGHKSFSKDELRELVIESLHSGKDQIDRDTIIENFNNGEIDVLVCTSLLSRGIDFKVDFVINYDCPQNIHDYIHRIGRTGRIRDGLPRHGTAYTLLDSGDKQYAKVLSRFWIANNLEIDEEVLKFVEH